MDEVAGGCSAWNPMPLCGRRIGFQQQIDLIFGPGWLVMVCLVTNQT